MIALTIDQAGERINRSAKTIRRWIHDGDLNATFEPITGQKYIWEGDLLAAERAARGRQRRARFTDAHQPERLAS